MDNVNNSNASGGGQKLSRKRKPQTEDPSIPDGTPSRKTQKTSAGTATPAAVDAGRTTLRLRPRKQQVAQEASNSSVANMAQATSTENTEQTTADTSAPIAVEGSPPNQCSFSLCCALLAYARTGNQEAAGYLLGYIGGRSDATVTVGSFAAVPASANFAQQRYDRHSASIDYMAIDKKNKSSSPGRTIMLKRHCSC
ncbi:hypothetical protein LTS10_006334 [Elasticomyces elasticus]|nr:hypothetical protein LTS10_006334 [Elasticomyces elasticus]